MVWMFYDASVTSVPLPRRHLLQAGGMISLAAAAGLHAGPLGLPIGCQTYPVREALGKDFDGTLRQLAAIGYRSIEMCSPPGYAKSGYGALIGVKAPELRRRIEAAGLKCESCHYQFREFKDSLPETIAYAKGLGLKQMVLSTFSLRNAPLSDWVRAAQDLNKAAEQIQKAGLQAAFHNHNVEFTELEGVLIYDKLLSELDPKLVKMQFQVWVVSMGVDAVALFEKHPGRFSSMHLQDYAPDRKSMVAIGKGGVDWKRLFGAARKAGVKNYYVEMDLELMKQSYPFLHGLS
jgi:sugar phosphate isomerase/epimerase